MLAYISAQLFEPNLYLLNSFFLSFKGFCILYGMCVGVRRGGGLRNAGWQER
jgi:hypothetical protein